LTPLLDPRSIAVVGASPRDGNFGGSVIRILKEDGFPGTMYAVNPGYEEVEGVPCIPALSDLPAPVDVAVLAVANDRVEASLQSVVARGVPAAVIYGSCFVGGDATLSDRLRRIAGEAGVRVCGGNSAGFCNYVRGFRLTAWPAVKRPAGSVTLLAHSGSVFSAMTRHDMRVRYNIAVSIGQELSVSAADYIDYALDLESTRAIALFLEGVREPESFLRSLARAQAQEIPIVVLKAGRTQASARMALSHSGALAGDDRVFDAVCRRYGLLRVNDLDELMATTILLQSGRRAAPGGLVSVHESGGERELAVDLAEEKQVPFASIGAQTVAKLSARLDHGLQPENPCDVFGTGRDYEGVLADCFSALLADPNAALGFFFFDAHQSQEYTKKSVNACLKAARSTEKLVGIATNYSGVDHRELALNLTRQGLPVIDGMAPALVAIRNMLAYRDRRSWGETMGARSLVADSVRDFWRRRFEEPRVLDEAESLLLLAEYGVPVVVHEVVESLDAASAAASRLGFPVVLKTAMPGILHKSDVNGVVLDIRNGEELKEAYDDLAFRLGTRTMVAKAVKRGTEMIIGVKVDPNFGPLVLLGSGGVLVEVIGDVRVMLAPVGANEVRDAIASASASKLLQGHRSEPAADIESLVDVVVRVATLVDDIGSTCAEGDLNPIRVSDRGAIVLDALFIPAGCRL
jgi:acyl-CoA synthetase (NDP forming)